MEDLDLTDKIEELFFETGEVAEIEEIDEEDFMITIGDLTVNKDEDEITIEKEGYEGILFYTPEIINTLFFQDSMNKWVYTDAESGTIEFTENEYKVLQGFDAILASIPANL